MDLLDPALQPPAERIALASRQTEELRTGHKPLSVTVVTGGADLTITLRGALSKAELATARTPEGAYRVQESHRQMFLSAPQLLKKDIERITGLEVWQADTTVHSKSSDAVRIGEDGVMVQKVHLSGNLPSGIFGTNDPDVHGPSLYGSI